ncbi:uncharacterized protein SOCE26_001640 [Sorangium cellulosum]|uniref:Uncharacterized protein n=1 Tax=Sorangium cellulosum TaxID=56 RepID=A0A2L0EHL9_SORCE|nr:uncharacterized protein SOCE26_001640 [Sorangium cellulosum]
MPRGCVPKADNNKAKSPLYPDEDKRLMAALDIRLSYRIYYGFLIREGMRADEAGRLERSSVPGDRGGALAQDQLGLDHDARAGAAAALDLPEQQVEAPAPQLGEVLADGGERRREVGRLRDVVEADDADVPRHRASDLVEVAEHAQRHLVVGHEHGGDAWRARELRGELVARACAPVAAQERRRLDARGLQRRTPAVDALLGLERVDRTGDVPHRPVTQVEEMARRGRRAAVLLDGDHRDRIVRPPLDGDHRHVGGDVAERVHRRPQRGDDHDAVGALIAQPVHRIHHRRAAERFQADDADAVPGVVRRRLEPVERRRRAVVRRVEADHAERPRAPGDERLRHGARAVVELADRVEHALPRVGMHVGVVVQDPRDRLVRDAGELGHIDHDRGPAPASLDAPLGRRVAVHRGQA